MIVPLLFLAGGAAALAAIALVSRETVPVHEPDLPPMPGSTTYRKVDAILPELKKAAEASRIPLGVLVGWIAKESGGRLDEVTPRYEERGYFQLMPDESKSLGLDHKRLSTDANYSINAGLLLIGHYMKEADDLGIPRGTSLYWKIVKLGHTMGSGDTKKLVQAAQAAGQAGSWEALEQFALSGAAKTKHSPSKWFPFIDAIYALGRPFGFGSEPGQIVVGALEFSDIVDPLDILPRRTL